MLNSERESENIQQQKVLPKTEHGRLIVLNQNIDQLFEKRVGIEKYREYRRLWEQTTKNLETLQDFPIQLDFELNYSCNLRCPMCTWSAEVTQGRTDDFEFDDFTKIIDEGVERGLKSVRLNYINEPLIRKDLPKFIKYCSDKGIIDIMLSSNAVLLRKEEDCAALIEAGLTKIQFSVDAYTPRTYEIMRVGTTLDKVIKSIDLFLEVKKKMKADFPLVRVNFVRSKENEHELEHFINFWKEREVDLIAIQGHMVLDVKTQNGAHILNYEKSQKKEIDSSLDFKCASPFRGMTVRNSGEILPCCTFYGAELVIDKLDHERTIYDAWNSDEYKKLREIHKAGEYEKNDVCKRCVESHSHLLDW